MVDDDVIDAFAVRNGIVRLALFGSALRDDFGPHSDIDLLVEFAPNRVPGLLHLAEMELDASRVQGTRPGSAPLSKPARLLAQRDSCRSGTSPRGWPRGGVR